MLTLFGVWWQSANGNPGARRRTMERTIRSWARLGGGVQLLLFGDADGLAEVARTLGAEHVRDVARNEYGTVRADDLFAQAQARAAHDVLCYANGDVILLDDLLTAVEQLSSWRERYLVIGECLDLDLDRLAGSDVDSSDLLRRVARTEGRSRGPKAIDYFVFQRNLYDRLPPFAIGRAGWDNWLVWLARSAGAAVVDASTTVTAVHQHHDYSHVPGGLDESYYGREAHRNLELAGGVEHYYFLWDATHRLTPAGVRRNHGSIWRMRNRFENLRGRITWHVRAWRAGRTGSREWGPS